MEAKTCIFVLTTMLALSSSKSSPPSKVHSQVDLLIENEITQKLTNDLIQSLERKFQGDLERSVDMVLAKIRLLLQNGTLHVNDKLVQVQRMVEELKAKGKNELVTCLHQQQNETVTLAEKALHQMVVCGYALIGHDPAEAVARVIQMKQMIRDGLKPISDHEKELFDLLKLCGHEQDTLKAVIKCVISKSPLIKTSMMDVTQKLIDGIVDLTKLMAHGAMHEACLIEVIRVVEDEALVLLGQVRVCALGDEKAKGNVEVGNGLGSDNEV